MSHQVIIIRGVTDDEHQNIEVQYTPPDDMDEDEARKAASKWVKWVKKQYEGEDE